MSEKSDGQVHSPVVEAASWRVLSEICRRMPGARIRHLHPGGGQYNSLTLWHSEFEYFVHLNRPGSFHVFARVDSRPNESGSWQIWSAFQEQDLPTVVDEACRRIGLAAPTKLPTSTPVVLIYRFIAELLATQAFTKERWYCVSAALDSSGFEGSYVLPAAKLFPALRFDLESRDESQRFQRATEWWIVFRDGEPALALHEDGKAVLLDRAEFDLPALYKGDRRIGPIVRQVLDKASAMS